MRPIDADALKKLLLEERDKIPLEIIERYSFGCPSPNKHGAAMRGGIRKALRCMENTPTLDVKPVKHGRWILKSFIPHHVTVDGYLVCPNCNNSFYRIKGTWFKRCPHCGTKMDGKEESKC